MKQFFKDYLTEMGKLTTAFIDMAIYGMLAGVFSFTTFFVFATLYGWVK